ncbi:MAG: hypothetical protein AAGK04_07835, partial [Planctomycetota bacterium]
MTANDRGRRRMSDNPTLTGRSRLRRTVTRLSPETLAEQAGEIDRDALCKLDGLENRILLGGDHPSFSDFPTATSLDGTFNGSGEAAIAGIIGTSTDDDLFSFTIPSDGDSSTTEQFVTALADVVNEGGSTLDSRVEVYNATGTLVASGSDATPPGATPITDDTPATDGWAGFVGAEGDTFFVRVRGENTTAGSYTLRIDARTSSLTADTGDSGEQITSGTIDRPLDDVVYRLVTSTDTRFDSLFTAHAVTDDPDLFDPRLEVFDSEGAIIVSASEGSTSSNAFTTFLGSSDSTFYFRVRGDNQQAGEPAAGDFNLVIDNDADDIPLDPVTRFNAFEQVIGIDSSDGMIVNMSQDSVQTELYSFVAQRTGITEINISSAGTNPIVDPAIALYDDTGTLIAFNEDLPGTQNAGLFLTLIGGETYYFVVDAFRGGGARHVVDIETGLVIQDDPELDDHADGPIGVTPDFDGATPLNWSTPVAAEEYMPIFFSIPAGVGQANEKVFANAQGRINRDIGNDEDSDLFVFVPPIDMLSDYEGRAEVDVAGTPADPSDDFAFWANRPASRLMILVEPSGLNDQYFDGIPSSEPRIVDITPEVRIYDSRGTLVGTFTNDILIGDAGGTVQIDDDNALAVWDPQQIAPGAGGDGADPLPGAVLGIEVWGGQPYYIEVSSSAGLGRYSLAVIADAFPDPTDPFNRPGSPFSSVENENEYIDGTNSTNPRPYAFITEAPNADQFELAETSYELQLDPFTGDGGYVPDLDGLYDAIDSDIELPGTSAGYSRAILDGTGSRRAITTAEFNSDGLMAFSPVPSDVTIMQDGGLLGIEHPEDTDLFFFRAPASGPIEVRIQTQNLADSFEETIIVTDGDAMSGGVTTTVTTSSQTETYDSFLDSALRVFNSDRVEIAFNDNSGIVAGQTQTDPIGSLGPFQFSDRDARLVFDAVAGNTYYIQVESALVEEYRANLSNPTLPVSWPNLIGSYDLHINALPSNPPGTTPDDHVDFEGGPDFAGADETASLATPIGLDVNGNGSVSGRITEFVGFPADTDGFTFYANANGDFEINVSRTSGDITPRLTVFDENGAQLGQPAVGDLAGNATFGLSAVQGVRFFIQIDAAGGLGSYDLSIDGPSSADDHADFERPEDATPIALNDFLGSGSATGVLERAGDTDIFSFEAFTFQTITFSVTADDFTLDPVVEVYELQVDRSSIPVVGGSVLSPHLALIASNDDIDLGAGNLNASVSVAVTADRVSFVSGLDYSRYFVLVRGANGETDFGAYSVQASFLPVDDHPDVTEF